MKFNSTLAFIAIFVVVIIGSGVVSGLKGYTLGYEALKEVSQPKVKPGQRKLSNANIDSSGQQGMIISEATILQQVNAIMNRSQDQAVPLNDQKASSNNDSFIESP